MIAELERRKRVAGVGAWTRAALLALVALAAGCGPGAPSSAGTPQAHAAAPRVASPATADAAPFVHHDTGFRSRRLLDEHYDKHGAEFGDVTRGQYLRIAQDLRDRPAGGDVLEIVRDDGVVTRYDRASGAFVAFDADGVIHTCFKPNDGERYFRRQALREHGGGR